MEKSSEIKYISPKESIEQGESAQHRFDLLIDGEKIGSAEIDYFSKPLPLYQLSDLYVDFEQKGKGLASKIMDQVEKFLKDRRKPGILANAILPGEPAHGMYQRRGWKKVPHSHGLLVFNWPSDVSLEILKGYALRQTDLMERPGYSQVA